MRTALKYVFLIVLLISSGTFYGCKVRTYSVVRERPDRETYGNRGYIYGTKEEQPIAPKTRQTYVMEIESGLAVDKKSQSSEGVKLETKNESLTKEQEILPVVEESTWQGSEDVSSKGVATARNYVVEKGDTLQKIAQKMYGTTKEWKKIYDANRDKIKNPDRIRPGQVLIIP